MLLVLTRLETIGPFQEPTFTELNVWERTRCWLEESETARFCWAVKVSHTMYGQIVPSCRFKALLYCLIGDARGSSPVWLFGLISSMLDF